MYEQLSSPPHISAAKLDGKISGDDLWRYQADLDARLKQVDPAQSLGMVIDLAGVSDFSGDALMPGIRADLAFLQHFQRFSRLALITDKEWPRLVVAAAGTVLPALEIRNFPASQRANAIDWAGEPVSAAPAETSAFRLLQTSSQDVFAFEINGAITAEAAAEVIEPARDFVAHHEELRMLVRIRELKGFDPTVLFESGLLQIKAEALKKSGRYAVVGAPAWLEKIIGVIDSLVPQIEIKPFADNQEGQAWQWIGASQTPSQPPA